MGARPRRRYESPLREEQHAATRRRLLEVVLAQMRAGAAELSMAEIARGARVSVPTVYRHFPTRRDLLHAIVEEVHRLVPPPAMDPDIRTLAYAFFRWREEVTQALGSAGTSPLVWELRRELTAPSRRLFVEALIKDQIGETKEPEHTWLVDLLVILFSDTMAGAFRGYLGLDADASAERALYCFDALAAYARRDATSDTAKKKPRGKNR